MTKTIQFLLTLTIIFSSNTLFAQSLDEVLKNHFEAIGQENLTKVKTYSLKAQITQMGMELPLEMIMMRPNKFYMEIEMQGAKNDSGL